MDEEQTEAWFDATALAWCREPGVELKPAFHAPGLRVHDRIFAMLVRGAVVLKLPAARCTELVESGAGERFQTGGRAMREWVRLRGADAATLDALLREAYAFVGGA